ncbi:hypothetical protein GE09DRAFT_215584 [Coniochaeta sp. 2T2.1]|nr:hypothetical protein GE09DRAFT_215584 [Coniochaeta sp. 2T2.1]
MEKLPVSCSSPASPIIMLMRQSDEEPADAELPDADGSYGSEASDDSPDDNSPDDNSPDEDNGDSPDDDISDYGSHDDPSDDEPSDDDTSDESEHEPLVFDADGDLRLVIGTGKDRITCLVCSKALARASPVFKSMLFGGFAESKPRDASIQWVVNLPEDDINAMAILLHIFHGQVHHVPMMLPQRRKDLIQAQLFNYNVPKVVIDVLYHITVVSDKYYVAPLLKPWAKSWIHQCRSRYCEDFAKLMWIAWVLGYRSMLISELEKLVLLSDLGPEGKTLGLTDVCLTHRIDDFARPGDGPEVILSILNISEKIRTARAVAIEAVLDPLRIYLDDPFLFMGPKCDLAHGSSWPGQ